MKPKVTLIHLEVPFTARLAQHRQEDMRKHWNELRKFNSSKTRSERSLSRTTLSTVTGTSDAESSRVRRFGKDDWEKVPYVIDNIWETVLARHSKKFRKFHRSDIDPDSSDKVRDAWNVFKVRTGESLSAPDTATYHSIRHAAAADFVGSNLIVSSVFIRTLKREHENQYKGLRELLELARSKVAHGTVDIDESTGDAGLAEGSRGPGGFGEAAAEGMSMSVSLLYSWS